jgi:hypothetical protein
LMAARLLSQRSSNTMRSSISSDMLQVPAAANDIATSSSRNRFARQRIVSTTITPSIVYISFLITLQVSRSTTVRRCSAVRQAGRGSFADAAGRKAR